MIKYEKAQCIKMHNQYKINCVFFLICLQDFLSILSKVSRGSVQEKLQWVFGLYDLNGDGLITKTEMLEVVSSIYEMLGRATQPAVEDTSAKEHVEKIFHVRFKWRKIKKKTRIH